MVRLPGRGKRATPDHVPDRRPIPLGPVNRKPIRRAERSGPTSDVEFPASAPLGPVYVLGGGPEWSDAVYNPRYDSWQDGVTIIPWSASGELSGPHAVVYERNLYVSGGQSSVRTDDVQSYEPWSDSWTVRASLPTTLFRHDGDIIGDKWYVCGGIEGSAASGSASTIVYDFAADAWTTGLANMNISRVYHRAVAVDGKLYAIGDADGSVSERASVEVYDPDLDTWEFVSSLPASRTQHAAALVDGRIHVTGGAASTSGVVQATHYMYDPGADHWLSMAPMPVALKWHRAAVAGGTMYVFNGYDGSSYLTEAYRYDLANDEWAEVATSPDTMVQGVAAMIPD